MPLLTHISDGFYLDHSPNCDTQEEDSADRLWLVIRSLKSPEGKYVNNLIPDPCFLGLQDKEV